MLMYSSALNKAARGQDGAAEGVLTQQCTAPEAGKQAVHAAQARSGLYLGA